MIRILVPAGATVAVVAMLAAALPATSQEPAIESAAAATAADPIAAAEQAVEDARARLRSAMAGNGNIRQARVELRRALQALEDARNRVTDTATTAESSEQPAPPTLQVETVQPPPANVAVAPLPVAPSTETVTGEADGRVIVREAGRLRIQSDDSARLQQEDAARRVERSADGTTTTTIMRPNGVRVVTVRGPDGEIVQRYRRARDGRISVLIGEEPERRPRRGGRRDEDDSLREILDTLPRITVTIPQEEYIVESDTASQRDIREALIAPPVEEVERPYTLGEITRSGRLRDKLRRIDVDTITFEFGSAAIPGDQIRRMQRIGNALATVIGARPDEVFLIEGHTDAVGSDLANLALSDRRAESVATVLSAYFGIPPENLVTQGYGEAYLKILTAAPERENRRVTLRRITPLLRGG